MNPELNVSLWQGERFKTLTRTFFKNSLQRVADASAALLLLALLFLGPLHAAAFQNLGFESPVFVPVPSSYQGSMDPVSALPGWTVFWGTNLAPYVLYDGEFLDSAGISILDTNRPYGFQALTQTIKGRYTLLLQGGFSLSSYPARQYVSIAQTSTINSTDRTMLFDVQGANFAVSVAGQTITPYALASFPNYTQYGVDVSAFSGQTVEIRFTVFPYPPPGLAINNVYLDAISFSSSALSAPPVIVTQPASQSPNWGATVDLTVSATGAPPPAYQWQFNGANILTGGQGATLELTNIQDSQSGVYTVIVTNLYGALTSSPAILTVQDPFIVSQPQNQSPSAGQAAGFFVSAGGTPPLGFQWLKNSTPLSDGGKISGSQTASMILNNVLGGDSGGYSVIISNGHGSVTSLVATLTVQDPIISDFQPSDQAVDVGGTAMFSVTPNGTPPFAYQWFDLSGRLADGGNISGSQSATLKVANVLASAADTYWVVVSNYYGSATSRVASASLNVPGYTVLHTFGAPGGNPYSGNPNAHLVLSGLALYGTAESAVYRISTHGTRFRTITSQIEGGNGGLILSGGILFGFTDSGYNEANPDYGRAYKVDTNGNNFAVLNTFNGGIYGALPSGAPVLSGTTLYGTTWTQGGFGYGTLFRVNTDGSGFTTILAFTNTAGQPGGVMAISGNTLYGTLTYDIVNGIAGKVFKVDADGNNFVLLKEFTGSDGREPSSLLLSGQTLYGTTFYGGTATPGIGSGTVFKVSTNGTGFAVLKNFAGGSDGANPAGDLVLLGSSLYGTTSSGGYSNNGTIFKIDTDGNNYAVLKRFHGIDGSNPDAGLVASGTMLYGTTSQGGPNNDGLLFALSLQAPRHLSLSVLQGCYQVTFIGIPGQTYSVLRAPNVTGPWVTIASSIANLDGVGFIQDTNPPPDAAFYRASYP
jgi:uncharacterized repeat protein (TIGR03803 family)